MTTTDSRRGQDVASDALLDILRRVTGLPWEWYRGDKKLLGVEGTWQLMPLNPKDEGDFWWWHLEHSRQWFDSKHEATTALLTAWFSYMSNARLDRPEGAKETP